MATRSLGTLTLDLVAKIGGYTEPLDRASRRTKRTSDDISKNMRRVGVAIAAAGVAAVAGTAALIKSQIDAADNLAKTSQAIGIEVEQLSALEYAAQLSGVEFNSLTSALGRFSRVVSDADHGLATAKRSFDTLDISIKRTDGTLKSSEELIGEIADRFADMDDGVRKTAVAQELFGRAGAQLIPLLNQGRDGIKGMTDEAERLGLVVDTKTAKAAEQFNDNLTRLQSVITGTGRELAGELLPNMVEFTNLIQQPETQQAIKDIVLGIADLASTLVRATTALAGWSREFGEFIGSALHGVAADDIPRLTKELAELDERIARLSDPDVEYSGSFGPLDEHLAKLRQQREDIQLLLDLNQRQIERNAETARSTEEVTTAIAQQEVATVSLADAIARYEELLGQTARTSAALSSSGGYPEYLKQLAESEELINGFYSDTATGDQLLARMFNLGIISHEEYVRGLAQGAQDMDENPFSQLDVYAEEAGRSIQNILADTIYDPFEGGIKGMVRGWADALSQMASQAIAADLASKLGFPGSGSGGNVASLAGAIGGILGFGGFLADGGPTVPGRAYMVGERGPELWVPNAHGQVISNEQTRAGRSGARDITQIFNVTGSIDRRTSTQIQNDAARKMRISQARFGG